MLGGHVFGWTVSERDTPVILDAAIAAGITAIDTADMYSAFAPGNVGGAAAASSGGLSARWIVRAAEDSLQRLQTDYIDLYQAHRDDAAVPLEESLAAIDQLLRAGKVRAIGASNYSAPRLKEALSVSAARGLARFETLQPLYNL
jgi:aryl-alcohol dehydrogenase-like predicted oxidoreductase